MGGDFVNVVYGRFYTVEEFLRLVKHLALKIGEEEPGSDECFTNPNVPIDKIFLGEMMCEAYDKWKELDSRIHVGSTKAGVIIGALCSKNENIRVSIYRETPSDEHLILGRAPLTTVTSIVEKIKSLESVGKTNYEEIQKYFGQMFGGLTAEAISEPECHVIAGDQ
jgi:hypothetical protein